MFGCNLGGFRATDRARLAQKRAQAAQAVANVCQDPAQMDTIQFALRTHRCFRTIAIFLLGMFSGITLWHIVASHMLMKAGLMVFLEHYFVLALPVHSLYFFLFAIAVVFALDRCVFVSALSYNQFILSINSYSLHLHHHHHNLLLGVRCTLTA